MGQKVNPYGLRLGIINDWRTRWYSEKEYAIYLDEDIKIRRYLEGRIAHAGISKIEIERTEQKVKIVIFAGRPGIVIGKRGAEVDRLRNDIEKMTGKKIRIDIQEVLNPEKDAVLIAQNVARQLEGRISFRRAMKKAVSGAMSSGVKGIKISSSGRLGGAEMARSEWYREGRVPLHTLKANIDYGFAEANTKSGKIGVKVWIYLGDVPLRGRAIIRDQKKIDEHEGESLKSSLIRENLEMMKVRRAAEKERAVAKEKTAKEKKEGSIRDTEEREKTDKSKKKGTKDSEKPAKKKEGAGKKEIKAKKDIKKKKEEKPKKKTETVAKKKKVAEKKTAEKKVAIKKTTKSKTDKKKKLSKAKTEEKKTDKK